MSPSWAVILIINPLYMFVGIYGHANNPAHVAHILQVEHRLCVLLIKKSRCVHLPVDIGQDGCWWELGIGKYYPSLICTHMACVRWIFWHCFVQYGFFSVLDVCICNFVKICSVSWRLLDGPILFGSAIGICICSSKYVYLLALRFWSFLPWVRTSGCG